MRPPASLLFTIFMVTLACTMPVHAQNTFHSQQRGGWQDFSYSYRTPANTVQNLQFSLNAEDIARGSREFQPWSDTAAREDAIAKVEQTARSLEQPNLRATVRAIPNGMDIRLSGYNLTPNSPQVTQLEETLHTTYTTSLQTYASRNLYRATPTAENKTTIQPDHPAIAVRYTNAMAPIAQAIRSQVPGAGASARAFINASLNFLQSIPYDTLQNRATSNGAGFQTPYGLLQGNLGDCDTKATALAALIRAAYPQIPLAIVYVPDHAFLAIGLPQESRDYALRTESGTYILADATGPGLTPLGYITPSVQAKVRGPQTDVLPIR